MIRLQKVLADRGVASRRRAEELITAGRVRVEGAVVTELGTRVDPAARIDVDGAPTRAAMPRYVVLHKPKGVVSTARDDRGRRAVVDLVDLDERLYPVGRLDADSEGLLLLTNDGEWAERVLHPRYGHEREYDVTVVGELTPPALAELRRGVRLEEGLARAERLDVVTRSRTGSRLHVVLRTGWKRQIRRMCAAVGLTVTRLVRVRVGPLTLGRLRPGEWRELSAREIADLARPAHRDAAAAAPKRPTNGATRTRATATRRTSDGRNARTARESTSARAPMAERRRAPRRSAR